MQHSQSGVTSARCTDAIPNCLLVDIMSQYMHKSLQMDTTLAAGRQAISTNRRILKPSEITQRKSALTPSHTCTYHKIFGGIHSTGSSKLLREHKDACQRDYLDRILPSPQDHMDGHKRYPLVMKPCQLGQMKTSFCHQELLTMRVPAQAHEFRHKAWNSTRSVLCSRF